MTRTIRFCRNGPMRAVRAPSRLCAGQRRRGARLAPYACSAPREALSALQVRAWHAHAKRPLRCAAAGAPPARHGPRAAAARAAAGIALPRAGAWRSARHTRLTCTAMRRRRAARARVLHSAPPRAIGAPHARCALFVLVTGRAAGLRATPDARAAAELRAAAESTTGAQRSRASAARHPAAHCRSRGLQRSPGLPLGVPGLAR